MGVALCDTMNFSVERGIEKMFSEEKNLFKNTSSTSNRGEITIPDVLSVGKKVSFYYWSRESSFVTFCLAFPCVSIRNDFLHNSIYIFLIIYFHYVNSMRFLTEQNF